jgi:hypothetical protein
MSDRIEKIAYGTLMAAAIMAAIVAISLVVGQVDLP